MSEFYDVLEAAAGHAKRALDVEEGLLRLRPEIARRANNLVVDVAALLAGDVENAARPGRLDRMIEALVLETGRRIEKAQASRRAARGRLRERLGGCAAEGGDDGRAGDEMAAGEVVGGGRGHLQTRIRLL